MRKENVHEKEMKAGRKEKESEGREVDREEGRKEEK